MPMCPSLKLWFSLLPHRGKVWGPARACGQGDEPSGTVGSVFRPVGRLTFPLRAEPTGFCSAGSFFLQPLSSSTGDSPSSTALTHVTAPRTMQLRAGVREASTAVPPPEPQGPAGKPQLDQKCGSAPSALPASHWDSPDSSPPSVCHPCLGQAEWP